MIEINGYSRKKAVEYAMKFALTPNPRFRYFPFTGNIGGDCANFLSQCLYAGQIPMVYTPLNAWWYKHSNVSRFADTWSMTWTVAQSLYWLLRNNFEKGRVGPKGQEISNINKLVPGDAIFFEDSGIIFHSALVTGFMGKPCISFHTYEALNIPLY